MRLQMRLVLGVAVTSLLVIFSVVLPPVRSAVRAQAQLPGTPAPAQVPVRATTSARTGTAVIRGRVIAGDTGLPLREAWVGLTGLPPGAPGESLPTVSTDEQGRFEFAGLPAGRFTLRAQKFPYVFWQYGWRRPSDPARTLELADGQVLDKIDFTLPRGGIVVARVTDDLGDPMAGVQVQFQSYRFMGGERRLTAFEMASTNDLGEAPSRPMPAGDYYIFASTAAGRPGSQPALGASDSRIVYAPTYYPGTRSVTDAQRVKVDAGQEMSVSFSLSPVRATHVSGIVRASDGSQPSRPTVTLTPSYGIVQLRPDGSFTASNVLPGNYTLEVRPPAAGDPLASQEYARVPLTVTGTDVAGLVVTTSRGADIRGRVVFDGGVSPPELRPAAFTVRGVGVGPFLSGALGRLTWNPDWTFELRGLWGRGVLRISPETSGWFLKAVMVDGKDVTDTVLEFAGRDLTGVEIILTQKLSEVSGAVVDARNAPVNEYIAVVFSEDREQWTAQSRFIATARSNNEGQFRIRGLPPGRYLAAAVESLETGEERDPELLARLQSSALRVTLGDVESRSVSLRLITF